MARAQPILVVDDDPDFRAEVRGLLESHGLPVAEAADGRAALDWLLTQRELFPSVILLDIEMPRMTGWELVTILKSYHRFASIPLVVISGRDCRSEAHERAIEACFLKPFAPDVFVRTVTLLRGGSPASD